MATGHGVQQIPETSAVLLPPQQSTLPLIEQRLVAEHQAAATASFAGAEPTETDRPEPAAAFAEAPAADEPMAIEAGPAAEEIPLEDIIANFLPQHQEKIRECLNDEDVQQILNAVRNFLTLLRESGIQLSPGRGRIPTPSLFGRLRHLTLPRDVALVRKFFEKATIFFSGVNPAQIKNTGCLSSMLHSNKHITNFANETEDNLRLLAGNPYLKQITSMCSRKGVPNPVKAAEILEWDCWKIDDTFSLELFRAFSSMMSGRGLIKDQAQVVEMLAWECWQPDGEFSMELLRAVSSMMSRRGFPDKDTLTAMLAWNCWKIGGKFSIELLRTFSSMMSSCGIPQKEKVEAILAWPCWQVDGKFSFDLLRTFSSMSHSRGLIKQAEVERVLAWPCWQVNGKFSLDLLRIFSSMSSSRGLLKDEARINAILAWECWKIEGEFSIDLLRIFSSMMNGQGLFDDEAQVQAILAWNCWQVDGKFSLPLLRTIASMMHGRGLLKDEARINAILAWECWKIEGEFSIELLRTVASMLSGRGLPEKEPTENLLSWSCWQVDGKFNKELLRIFSSMMAGCGIPKKEKVEAILAWPCWRVDGNFSLPLLRTIVSMMASRSLPKKAQVEQLLLWPCWQVNGKFSLKLLQIFSVMMIGKGMLNQTAVEAFMAWLPSDRTTLNKEQICLKVACQLFSKTGLPDPKILADIEATLRQYISEEAIASDEEENSDSEDEPQKMVQIKALTLFCAAPAKWRINIAEIEQFLGAHNTAHHDQNAFRTTLDSLLRILANHGQAGLRFWLKYYSGNPNRKHVLTRALRISAPLAHTKFALTELPESEWPDYIELCKNLTPTPTREQWQALKPLRNLLHRRFTLTFRKRMMLEILWPQSERNRLRYTEKLDTLLSTVPTIDQLHRLHQVLKPLKLQAFLDACLARENMAGQSINETVPEIKTQEILLEGLLLTNHYLNDHGHIPELCFSEQIAGAYGSGVIVDGAVEMSGNQRLWHFIAAMLIELKQTEYQFKQQKLRISPPDSETIILPKPEFTAAYTGFVITNWSLEQLTAFFRATEFTEHWYKNPDDTRDISVTRREQRLQQMRERPQNTTQTGYKARNNSSRSLLSPTVIINIIKQGNRLKPSAWSSLEHYARTGQLSDTLCRLLAPIIEQELASTVPYAIPEIVKRTVSEWLGQTGASQTVAVVTATQSPSSPGALATAADASPIISRPSQMLPASLDIALDMALDTMARDMAIAELEHFTVLGGAELDMLEPWRDQMTYSQLMNVMTKINLQSVEPETVTAWQQTFENRRRDHLGLDLDEFLDSMLEGGVEA